jgi:protease-4
VLRDNWRNLWIRLDNRLRRAAPRSFDYLVLEMAGSLPEHIPPRRWWQRMLPAPGPAEGLSLSALRAMLERLATDPRPAGLIVRLEKFAPAGWATVNSVRDTLLRLRAAGKRVVAYADDYGSAAYYTACAADEPLA